MISDLIGLVIGLVIGLLVGFRPAVGLGEELGSMVLAKKTGAKEWRISWLGH